MEEENAKDSSVNTMMEPIQPEIKDKEEVKPKLEVDSVIVEREGRQVLVEITSIDFSEGDKNAPLEIYCQGFGQGTEGITDFDDLLMEQEARKLKAQFAKVSIRNLPPLYDEKSDKEKDPTFGADARIILEALEKKEIEAVGRPVYVSGYSEGAGVALELAGEIDKRQKEARRESEKVLPENKLRLWSLTGTMDLDPKPRGLTVAGGFIAEVSKITLIDIAERYKKLTGENVLIEDKDDLKDFVKKFTTFVAKPNNWKAVWGELKDSKEGNLGMLLGVLKRMTTGKNKLLDGLQQLRKMESRSEVCDELGQNWDVKIAVPRNDIIYPWWKVKRTIRNLKNKSEVEVMSPDTPGTYDPNRAVKLTDLGKKYLFPNAGKVDFTVIGESRTFIGEREGQKGIDLGQVHVGPENHPEAYFDASSFV